MPSGLSKKIMAVNIMIVRYILRGLSKSWILYIHRARSLINAFIVNNPNPGIENIIVEAVRNYFVLPEACGKHGVESFFSNGVCVKPSGSKFNGPVLINSSRHCVWRLVINRDATC